ncbi:MAG TPA: DNA polymerase III subunit delta' [Pyrinomonadaceae bacterium]
MFDKLVGNQRAREVLGRMLAQGRVPGALIFAGEEAVGKKLFAVELAKALNCRRPRGAEACDECPACKRIPRFAPSPSDNDERKRFVAWSEHPDVALVRREAAVVNIYQARVVERESNFRPQEGRARVFIIEEADRMNLPAANALLKTLEEAPPTSHLILLTTRPSGLLPTIRSRCQIVRFAPLAACEIEDYLTKNRKRAGLEARLVARLARGRLGRALDLDLDAYRGQRDAALSVLEALLAAPPDRARLLRSAEELTDPKRKDEYEAHLDTLSALVHDAWLLSLSPDAEIVNEDLRERLARSARTLDTPRAARWLALVEDLRAQLAVNVNRKIATDALFLSMAAA